MDGILVIKDKRYKDSSSKNLYFNLSRKKKLFRYKNDISKKQIIF